MYVKIYLPGPMEGEVVAKDESGRKVKVAEVQVAAFFYKPDGKPLIAHVESLDDSGKVIGRYAITQAGTSGEVSLSRRRPCKTLFDNKTLTADSEEEAEVEEEA